MTLNRKALSNMAIEDPVAFKAIVTRAKEALSAAAARPAQMITLEQIRLLESKITRAIELIRVLKDENGTLRKGLESAQKRMKELESLVDGFKTDQQEIESVIVRTLHNLDELEESATGGTQKAGAPGAAAPAPRRRRRPATHGATGIPARRCPADAVNGGEPSRRRRARAQAAPPTEGLPSRRRVRAKEELDIF